MQADLLLQVPHSRFELCILPTRGRVRQVVYHDIRIDPVHLNQPLALGTVDARLCRRCPAEVPLNTRAPTVTGSATPPMRSLMMSNYLPALTACVPFSNLG